ncbi:MAG TPA: glycosyltransferase family 4 protein [Dehalococcoidia bacterium]|nr:glycosyltransferase family 4 protein [Dehalococcoidia bacterium]
MPSGGVAIDAPAAAATRTVFLEPLWKLRREYQHYLDNPPPGYRFVVRETATEGLARRLSASETAYRALWLAWQLFPMQLLKPWWERAKRPPSGTDLTYSVLHPVFRREPWLLDMRAEQPHLLVGGERLFERWKGALRGALLSSFCRRIVYEVEAGRRAFLQRFGWPELAEKTVFVRSGVPLRLPSQGSGDGRIKLLFVNSANINVESHFAVHGGLVLLEAFLHLRRRYPQVELVIRSSLPPAVKRSFAGVPGLRVIDEIIPWPQLEREFLTADVFVYPTHITPSIVMLDAMSYGLPVVTTDVWANPELVQEGHHGLLVAHPGVAAFSDGDIVHFDSPQFRRVTESIDPGLVSRVVAAVSRLIEDAGLRHRLGAAGRREVEDGRFSLKQRDEALGRVLDEAISGEQP